MGGVPAVVVGDLGRVAEKGVVGASAAAAVLAECVAVASWASGEEGQAVEGQAVDDRRIPARRSPLAQAWASGAVVGSSMVPAAGGGTDTDCISRSWAG